MLSAERAEANSPPLSGGETGLNHEVEQRVRRVLSEVWPGLDSLPDRGLLEIGLTSMQIVAAIFAIENEFGIEFNDEGISFSVFDSLSGISAAVVEAQTGGAA